MRYSSEPEQDEATCCTCSCRVAQGRVARMEHEDCEPQGIEAARVREAQRNLHRDTAWMLRKLGQPERAAVHDTLAEGRW